MTQLTDTELSALAAEVDAQLNALQAAETFAPTRAPRSRPPAPKQQAAIEQATGQPFETFWQKFRRLLRADLCQPGGALHGQWQRWRDLDSKAAVGHVHSLLLGMGIAGHTLTPVAIAATVILLNTLLNVGIQAICEDGETH